MNATCDPSTPVLPGYTLEKRLGAGGYGEVWLAHAPGGLTKAVKFVYGSYHERRAEHELKALERIKEVRHPFLLSVERVEVVDGRLAIVTELADGSLKDRFDECRAEGLRGIPREELLGYLRDAADGLDFLCQKHKLQHLDVKPENLLMVGGHVKVADFGLVKDLGATQASMVGGLTPLYSAPEVFQGEPSLASDQYSLAILLQEMLTGTVPFAGVSAAELTLQRLNDDPDLSPMPMGDRYLVARALSKDPMQRYASCTEMVRAVASRPEDSAGEWSATETRSPGDASFTAQPPKRGPVTQLFDEPLSVSRATSTSMLLEAPSAPTGAPTALPPLDLSDILFQPRPTLVLGVGGLASAVLRKFRVQLANRYGEDPLPSVRLLLLDTDPREIAAAHKEDSRAALRSDETMLLALRRPQEYREQSERLLGWLSRRWLYNIPKSLQTEGVRPLGRLAFADHARQATQRIRMAIAEATSADALAETSRRTGTEFQNGDVRVILVASISGGAGSGMSLDVAYAVRTLLDKMGLAGSTIVGLMMHSADGDDRRCDLARVNARAWLSEYNHFHRPGGSFPGDDSCGLPPLAAGRRAFDSAYLVDTSSGRGAGPDHEAAVESVADYAFLEALTPAGSFFAACRCDEHAAGDGKFAPLRTFSARRISVASEASLEAAAAAVAQAVVLQWTGKDSSAVGAPAAAASGKPDSNLRDTDQLVPGVAALVNKLQLTLEGLASNARGFLEAQLGVDQKAFAEQLVGAASPSELLPTAVELVGRIDALFAAPHEHDSASCFLGRPLDEIVSPVAMKLAGDLGRWVVSRLDERQQRLAGAQLGIRWIVDHLKSIDADAVRMIAALGRPIHSAAETARKETRADARPDARRDAVASYLKLRIDHQSVIAANLVVRRLLAEMKALESAITEFGRHLKHLAANLPAAAARDAASAGENAEGPCDQFLEIILGRLWELADGVDARLQTESIAAQGGLFQTIMGHSRIRAQTLADLKKFSREAVAKAAADPAASASIQEAQAAKAGVATAGLDDVPPLLSRGGVYARLVVGSGASMASVPGASVLSLPGSDSFVCCEGWALPLSWVADDLIHSRRDYADFAERVHTRSDVSWTLLTPIAAASPVAWPVEPVPCHA